MKRAVFAPGATSIAVALLAFFAAGGLLIAVLMAIGAPNIVKNSGGSVTGIYIGAAVIGAIAAVALWWTSRQWSAITAIEVDDGWTLLTRTGKRTPIARGTDVELALRCRRVIYTLHGIPRWQDVVDGTLTAGSTRRRLAPSGPTTYSAALATLGITAPPPQRGQTAVLRTRS
jgi:hypothetical protein